MRMRFTPGEGMQVPLNCFAWNGEQITIAPGVSITYLETPPHPGEEIWRERLDEKAKQELDEASHWLVMDEVPPGVSAAEVMNVFFIALWLAVPTEAHARHRWGADPAVVHDVFCHVTGRIERSISDAQLLEAGRYYQALLDVARSGGRLDNSLYLTYAGCTLALWQPSYICFTSALEGLLTHRAQTRDNISHLGEAFALLTETDAEPRREARKLLKRLYDVRSQIVHGRAGTFKNSAGNLNNLRDLRDALRSTWAAILTLPGAVAAFDGEDEDRAAYLVPRVLPRAST